MAIKYYTEKQVEEMSLPRRGRLVISLLGESSDPEIPDFLKGQVSLQRTETKTASTPSAADPSDMGTNSPRKSNRRVLINCPEYDEEILEGQLAVVDYRLFSVRFDGELTYHYVVSVVRS